MAYKKPNVLLLFVDDMNPWFSCFKARPFSHPFVQTPCLDNFIESASVFTNAHCPSPLCNPSRTAVLTGRHPTKSGIYKNYCWWRPAMEGVPTLPEYFRSHGYRSIGGGKIFHHCVGFNPPGQWDDFQDLHFDDPWDRKSRVNYPHLEPAENPEGFPFCGINSGMHEFDWGSLEKEETEYGDMLTIEFAKQVLSERHSQPFLLACGLFRPHLPWYAPKRFFDLYRGWVPKANARIHSVDWAAIPEMGQFLARLGPQGRNQLELLENHRKLDEAICAYLANISFADYMIGQILEALRASSHKENTVVVFCGDHGFHVGERNHFGKATLWDESTHVPFIIQRPGQKAGLEIKHCVSTLDLLPTLASICGLPGLSPWNGNDLLPLMDGNAPLNPDKAVLCSLGPSNHAVITDRYRYIQYEDGGEELYDRETDPWELHNIIARPGSRKVANVLGEHIPSKPAKPQPGHEAYDFDWKSYTWTLKEGFTYKSECTVRESMASNNF